MFDLGSYFNPVLLWLAAGALAPVIIHLATRSRPKITPFPAVRFILASHRSTQTKFKLKQLLLLILRIAALALFAFVIARPWTKGSSAADIQRSQATVTAVILLDNSYSMGYRHDDTTSFEKARNMALTAVDAFSLGESRVCFLLVGDSPQPVIRDFSYAHDLDALRAQIKDAHLSTRGTDCPAALKEAVRMLKGVQGVGKSVFLFTDLTAHSWPAPLPAPPEPDDITFYIADAGAARPVNSAILGAAAPENAAPGTPFEVKARVDAIGSAGQQVELIIDGERRDRKPASAHQIEQIALLGTSARNADDEHWGAVCLTAQDNLPVDNALYFTFRSRPLLKVILVNGSPSSVKGRDELDFLRTALAPSKIPDQAFQLRELRPGELESTDLTEADIVALCNVGPLPAAAWTKLRHFVSTGHGLIVFGGSNVTPAALEPVATGSTALLPCSVQAPVTPPEPTRLEPGKLQHTILRTFEGGRNGDLAAARFTTYLKLKPGEKAEPVLAFKTGDPALVAGRCGTGTVLVFASTCDLDWNTLPREVAYVILMNESFQFLVASRSEKRDIRVGLAPLLRVASPATAQSVTLARLPVGSAGARDAEAGRLAGGEPENITARLDARTGQLALPIVDRPGIYRVAVTRKDGKPGSEQFFAANLETAESNLERIPEGEDALKSLLPQRTVKVARNASQLCDQISRSESVAELASHLAGIVLALLLGEMFLSNRMRARAQVAAPEPTHSAA